ncbi:FAST kinase domain-containing protein 5, mitochondrial [Halichoeres trimaculatus]|uniref:FAST kinase domain-containing protein 5, mitochondrial n=1 Tax=Halichoeres trimaculatus TaxID=147232 RepID=UPI003D9E7290
MAACVLCRRLPRLRCLPGWRKGFTQARHEHIKRLDETVDHEGKEPRESSPLDGYRLHYNPTSYHPCVGNSAASWSHMDNEEDEQCLPALTPSLWQQRNHYSVSCSRHLSSSKNTLLDLAFDKRPKQEIPSGSQHDRKPMTLDVRVDPRAFLKCRPEYASTTLDLTQRPCPIKWEEAVLLLKKVAALKGSMKPSDVSQTFTKLSGLHPDFAPLARHDQRFIMLLRYSVENLCLFTDPELLEVLQAFVWLSMPSTHSVLSLYEAELCHRAGQMTLHQLLFVADLWRCIRKQVPQFLKHLYDSVLLNLGQIGVPELVQLLYIMGEGRQCPPDLIRPLEQLLMQHLPQLRPEEVGTVCLGLFKSQTSLSESSVTCLVDKGCSLVKDMSAFGIVNVLKYMRFNYLYHRLWMEAMAEEIPLRAHSMGIKGIMHVALTCSALHCRSDDILGAIAERVPSVALHCRSKDASKLLWAFGNLQFFPDQGKTDQGNVYSALTESMRKRKAEYLQYPEHLLTGLLGLAFVSQFPEDLYELALSPNFVDQVLKPSKIDMRKDLLTLDGILALEFPHWTGPRLSSELREEVTQMLWTFAQSDICQKPEVLGAEFALEDLLGGEMYVRKRMVLPHTRSIDLEVHLDSSGKPLPVDSESHLPTLSAVERSPSKAPPDLGWGQTHLGVTLTDQLLAQLVNTKKTSHPLTPKPISCHRVQPREEERLFDTGLKLTNDITEALIKPGSWGSSSQDPKCSVKLAIQVPSRNYYCCHSDQLLGIHVMKRRHLKMAGYQVVELSYREWFPMLRKSRAEKLGYLHCKIYSDLP